MANMGKALANLNDAMHGETPSEGEEHGTDDWIGQARRLKGKLE